MAPRKKGRLLETENKGIRARSEYIPRIVVKFKNSIRLPYEDAVERYFDERFESDTLIVWKKLVQRFPTLTLNRLITSITPKDIEKLSANFLTYFVLTCPPGKNQLALAQKLTKILNTWSPVELAYVKSPLGPPPGVTRSSYEVGTQRYHGPEGINAECAWGITGGDGAGLHFIDIEQGWVFDHEDLGPGQNPPTSIVDLSAVPPANYQYADHGTAVLGVVLAVPGNADHTIPHGLTGCKDCVGISPNVKAVNVVCEIDLANPGNTDRENAIVTAIANLHAGDVLLLECQIHTNAGGHLPVELEYFVYQAIETATIKGIVVIEPVGNGKANGDGNLDNLVFFGDSGAIMVASGYSTANNKRACPQRYCRPPSTNYGWNRVNCFGWGDRVYTPSVTGLVHDYTDLAGTSAASAMVAGAVLALQGIAQANQAGDPTANYRFRPALIRNLLSDPTRRDATKPETGNTLSGKSTYDPSNLSLWNAERIGVVPNLKAIVEELNLVPDIYIRDNVMDDGSAHTGSVSSSPDIILLDARFNALPELDRQAAQVAYGEGSGTEGNPALSVEAVYGKEHYIYLRFRNRGGAGAENVAATVYWSNAGTLLDPNLWNRVDVVADPQTPSVVIPQVPMGNVLTLSSSIIWPGAQIPPKGHYCFVAVVGNAADPPPLLADFQQWDNFVKFIRDNNNVAWRNFNVVEYSPSISTALPLEFTIVGAWDDARAMSLEVEAQLPKGARLHLKAPISLRKIVQGLGINEGETQDTIVVSIDTNKPSRTKEVKFSQGLRSEAVFLVHFPEQFRKDLFHVYVRQFYKGQEVGGITWRLMPKRPRLPRI